jgi:Ca2+-dependent lipid-binding protein
VAADQFTPSWNQTSQIFVTVGMKLQISLYDKDVSNDDLIGSTAFTITLADIVKGNISLSFDEVAELVVNFK